MTMTDPIADLLTRIRNGLKARKTHIDVPASTMKGRILDVMVESGYISGHAPVEDAKHPTMRVELKYDANGMPVIQEITRVSKPGLRAYKSSGDVPMTRNGLGITIVTTSKGVMTDTQAKAANVGGEVVCQVF